MAKESAAELLADAGPLASELSGFAARAEQIDLAGAIEGILEARGVLVAEAGTGIGKTLAYLVPVLTAGQRAIVSTGTKTLQDQLFFRDLPLVIRALGSSAQIALLKGRGNYLCTYRAQQARQSGRLPTQLAVSELEALNDWSAKTPDGDLTLTELISDESGLWPMVTSTTDNCLGGECPDFEDCFVAAARRKAQEADVVVVNHHLLFADMAIK